MRSQQHSPAALSPGNNSGIHGQENEYAPGPVWAFRGQENFLSLLRLKYFVFTGNSVLYCSLFQYKCIIEWNIMLFFFSLNLFSNDTFFILSNGEISLTDAKHWSCTYTCVVVYLCVKVCCHLIWVHCCQTANLSESALDQRRAWFSPVLLDWKIMWMKHFTSSNVSICLQNSVKTMRCKTH